MRDKVMAETTDYAGLNFRAPRDLEVAPPKFKNVLLIGQCLVDRWAKDFRQATPGTTFQHVLFNLSTELPEQPPLPPIEYDFQIVSLPLRGVLHENMYLILPYLEEDATQAVFQKACERMSVFLHTAMRWNRDHNMLSFVTNFFVPQQNPDGRLFERYSLRNMVYFVECLNERLSGEISNYRNAILLDIDQISASLGRRHIQDDTVCINVHGSLLNEFDLGLDRNRIEPPK